MDLTAGVTVACAVIGVAAAWVVERTNLPGRRVWAALIVLPLAMPDFVVGYAWTSVAPAIHGLAGALLVMTLSIYPLVYLPVAASLRTADPALEEVAHSLGHGRIKVFARVTLPQIRTALIGGCLLVALALLAEYGAFEIVGYQTFTTEIVTEFRVGFDSAAACALSLILVMLGIMVLAGDAAATAGKRMAPRAPHGTRPPRRRRLGLAAIPATGAFAVLAGAAVGVPVVVIGYWMIQGQRSSLPPASIASAAANTVAYSLPAAAVATIAALPVALLGVRHRSRGAILLERSTYLVQGLPGPVIALSFVFFAVHYAIGIYQSPELLVAAYAVLFFPLALIAVRAALTHAPPQLEEVARSLGRRPVAALVKVTLPLIAPGLAAAFSLVFLSAVIELTTTLILIPPALIPWRPPSGHRSPTRHTPPRPPTPHCSSSSRSFQAMRSAATSTAPRETGLAHEDRTVGIGAAPLLRSGPGAPRAQRGYRTWHGDRDPRRLWQRQDNAAPGDRGIRARTPRGRQARRRHGRRRAHVRAT